jgi:hypothetical protein
MVWELPLGRGIKLIGERVKQKAEERAWQLYCSAYPHFSKKNFKTFEQFYPKSKSKPKKGKAVTQADMERFADIADLLKHRERK